MMSDTGSHFGLLPLESNTVVAPVLSIDGRAEFARRCKAGAMQGGAGQHAEPALDQGQPACMRPREVKVNLRVLLKPAVTLRLVGAEVVENYMDFAVGFSAITSFMNEKELYAPPTASVLGQDP